MTTQTASRTRHSKPTPLRDARKLAIRDVMARQPHTIGSDQTLEVAHRMMLKYGIRHLPVLANAQLVGILSQRDLYFLETIAGVELSKDLVEDAMSPDTYTVDPNASVALVASMMVRRKLGSAVVVEDGHVVGIFTANDALRLLAQ